MGERTEHAISEAAPVVITDISHNYSVQVDTDVLLGASHSANDDSGIECWEHVIPGGDGAVSAFLLEVDRSSATIGLWDNVSGAYHQLASESLATPFDTTSGAAHLTAQCIQAETKTGTSAQLSLAVNGTTVVSVDYPGTVKSEPWAVGNKVGVLAMGAGSDIFYDKFAITSKCRGSYC